MPKNFNHKIKVYYEDTDAGGVVYYANYLKYLERARTEALIKIGLSNLKIRDNFKALIIVKSCNIEYKKPVIFEDNLTIESIISEITQTSFIMKQNIKKDEELMASAEIHLVSVNLNGKPTKIPDILKQKLSV